MSRTVASPFGHLTEPAPAAIVEAARPLEACRRACLAIIPRMFGSRRSGRSVGAAPLVPLLAATVVAATMTAGCASERIATQPSATAPATTASVPTAPDSPPAASTSSTPSDPATTGASTSQRQPSGIPPAHPVPAAFRPAPGAPSDAEVERELELMAAAQRREAQLRLSAAAANLAGLLPWSLESKTGVHTSIASVFTDYGLGLACGGVLGRDQLGVAHKTAPCGTLITFTYAGRSLTVPVIDRGPYIAGREWDLTGATAEALGFPGLGPIQWSVASEP